MIRKIKEGEINMKDGKLKKLTGKDFQFKVVNNYDFYKDLSVFDW